MRPKFQLSKVLTVAPLEASPLTCLRRAATLKGGELLRDVHDTF